MKDKSIKTNKQLESQLLKKYEKQIPQPDIFQPIVSLDDQLKAAYRLRNQEIAYSPYTKQILVENYD